MTWYYGQTIYLNDDVILVGVTFSNGAVLIPEESWVASDGNGIYIRPAKEKKVNGSYYC